MGIKLGFTLPFSWPSPTCCDHAEEAGPPFTGRAGVNMGLALTLTPLPSATASVDQPASVVPMQWHLDVRVSLQLPSARPRGGKPLAPAVGRPCALPGGLWAPLQHVGESFLAWASTLLLCLTNRLWNWRRGITSRNRKRNSSRTLTCITPFISASVSNKHIKPFALRSFQS